MFRCIGWLFFLITGGPQTLQPDRRTETGAVAGGRLLKSGRWGETILDSLPNTWDNSKNNNKKVLCFLYDASKCLSLLLQDFLGAEEAARLSPESPDEEFEGMGDYEESIYSDWKQPKGKGDTGQSEAWRQQQLLNCQSPPPSFPRLSSFIKLFWFFGRFAVVCYDRSYTGTPSLSVG